MSASIPLFRRREVCTYAIVDDDDYERIASCRWGLRLDGYAVRRAQHDGRWIFVRMHREILRLPHGVWFAAGLVDHINNDRLDNRKANLRVTTHGVNAQRGNLDVARSGYRGVHQLPAGGWRAKIQVGGECLHLGVFPSPELAALAYDAAALRHFGQYARLNVRGGMAVI